MIQKNGAIFHSERTGIHRNFDFSNSLSKDYTYAYTVDRGQFDKLLLDHVNGLGVKVFQPCTLKNTRKEDDYVVINEKIKAKLVVHATGIGNKTAFQNQYIENNVIDNKTAIIGYFKRKPSDFDHLFGNIFINIFYFGSSNTPQWSWATPINPDEISVGIVVDSDLIQKESRKEKNITDLFFRLLSQNPFQQKFIDLNKGPIRPIMAKYNFQRIAKNIVFDQEIFLGDAAGFIDPVFSSGVHLGAISAKLAQKNIIDILKNNKKFTRANLLPYQENYRKYFWLYYKFVKTFYQKNIVENIFLKADFSSFDNDTLQKQQEFSSILSGDVTTENPLFHSILNSRITIPNQISSLFKLNTT